MVTENKWRGEKGDRRKKRSKDARGRETRNTLESRKEGEEGENLEREEDRRSFKQYLKTAKCLLQPNLFKYSENNQSNIGRKGK